MVSRHLLCVHGGGFLGSLWLNEEEMFRTTLKIFPNNTVIVLPQTIYFSKDEEGQKELKKSKEIYSKHNDLYICCREEYSYKFMKQEFPKCNIMLIPDMVLYLDGIKNKENKNDVLFCIRKDKEKVHYNMTRIEECIHNRNLKIDYTDTVIGRNIYFNKEKNKIIFNKIDEFSKYKLVITDRLHGMIFSLLAHTPCLVFENKSYKIKGVYKWIENIDYIKLCDETKIEEQIAELLLINNPVYDNKKIKQKYNPLIELITKKIERS